MLPHLPAIQHLAQVCLSGAVQDLRGLFGELRIGDPLGEVLIDRQGLVAPKDSSMHKFVISLEMDRKDVSS